MSRRVLAIAALWGLVVALGAYPVLRLVSYMLFPEPNPATVISSLHVGYFWRILNALYLGGMVALVAGFIARRAPSALERAFPVALLTALTLAVAQALFVP